MRNFGKDLLSLLICAVLLFGTLGCSSDAFADGFLNLVDSPATTLDNVWYNTGGIFRCAVFDSMLSMESDMATLRPALARKYNFSDDGLNYSFELRNDVKWHDGEHLNASDVIFSLKTLLRCGKVNGLLDSSFSYIDGAEAYKNGEADSIRGITVKGNTITFHLVSPVGDFLNAVSQFAILPEHILRSVPPSELDSNDYWKQPIGCGPYKIAEAMNGKYFILERNEDYYGAKPGIKTIHLMLDIDDPVSAITEGSVDLYVTNDPEYNSRLNCIAECTPHQLNIIFPAYLLFNLSHDSTANDDLKDIRVRKALLMAIDRKSIVSVLFPDSTVTDTMVPSWDSWYLSEGESFDFNPEEAKRLLAEANFDFSKTIRLKYFTKGQSTADLMNAIAVYWRAIGVKTELEMFDGSGSEHMFQIRDYDVCYKRLSAFNHGAIYEEVAGTGIMQKSILGMPVYDELIETMNTSLDRGTIKNAVSQMQKLDKEYLLRLPLFSLATVAYVRQDRFKMPDAYGNIWYRYNLRFEDWRLFS